MRGTVDKTVDTVSVFFLCFIIFNGELPVHFVAGFQMSFFFTQCKIFVFRCKSTFPKYCGHYGPWSLVLATWQSAGLPYMGPDAMGAGFESVPSFFFKKIGVTRHSVFFFLLTLSIHNTPLLMKMAASGALATNVAKACKYAGRKYHLCSFCLLFSPVGLVD